MHHVYIKAVSSHCWIKVIN